MSRRGRRDDLHGVLVVDKPAGVTSAQVVTLVRRRMGVKPVGHTGTLDPLATGVLPVCLGEACKLVSYLVADDKAYEAELELGIETDTLDIEGMITARAPEAARAVTEDGLRTALAGFVGPIWQVPPMYSAVKVDGRRLHKLAREGVEIERQPRQVTVHRLELLSFDARRARLRIECSKGTFVRTLAADLGRVLGCGAHLTALRRTRSGAFTLAQAVPIDAITGSRYDVVPVIALPDVVDLPRWHVPEPLLRSVLDGRLLTISSCKEEPVSHPSMRRVLGGGFAPAGPSAPGQDINTARKGAYSTSPSMRPATEGVGCNGPHELAPSTAPPRPPSTAPPWSPSTAPPRPPSTAPQRPVRDDDGGGSAYGDDGELAADAEPTDEPGDESRLLEGAEGGEPLVQLLTPAGALLAIARLQETTLRPIRVFTYGLTRPVPSANLARSNDSNP